MAEPKSLLDRIGGALKGAAEEKKAEAQVKPAAQAMPDRIEQQAQRVAEAADAKAAEMKRAVAEATQKLEAQLADLRVKLADKERELYQKNDLLQQKERELANVQAKLAEKERELASQRSEVAEKTVALVQKDRQIAELQAALKAAQAEVETLRVQAAPAARTVAAEAPAPASTPARTYVVKPGDNLSAIAQAVYGNAARWPEIFEANKDRIKDPRLIRPGQELRIP